MLIALAASKQVALRGRRGLLPFHLLKRPNDCYGEFPPFAVIKLNDRFWSYITATTV